MKEYKCEKCKKLCKGKPFISEDKKYKICFDCSMKEIAEIMDQILRPKGGK